MTTEAPSTQMDIAIVAGAIAAGGVLVIVIIVIVVQRSRSLQLYFLSLYCFITAHLPLPVHEHLGLITKTWLNMP